MLRRTIFGMVVILPRVVSSMLLTFGALTFTPLSPSSFLLTRRFAESNALRTGLLALPRVLLLHRLGHSVTSDDQERYEPDQQHDETVAQSVRDGASV